MNSPSSCPDWFDRWLRGAVKGLERRLGRDPVRGGAPRVALKSARPLRTPLIVVETNKESTRLEKLGFER
jgi:hypothetical protein